MKTTWSAAGHTLPVGMRPPNHKPQRGNDGGGGIRLSPPKRRQTPSREDASEEGVVVVANVIKLKETGHTTLRIIVLP